MDAIDRYLERLADPRVVEFNRSLNNRHAADGDDWMLRQGRLTEDQVVEVERVLGFPLPPSYRKLVTSVPRADAEYGLLWAWMWSDDGEDFPGDIVLAYQDESNWKPPFLLMMADHENGDSDCFDLRRRDERGECPIVRWDHEVHHEDSTEFETVAGDLGDYLLGSLDPRPGDGADGGDDA